MASRRLEALWTGKTPVVPQDGPVPAGQALLALVEPDKKGALCSDSAPLAMPGRKPAHIVDTHSATEEPQHRTVDRSK